MSDTSSIPAAVNSAVVAREPLPIKTTLIHRLRSAFSAKTHLPAQPALDEAVIEAALRNDAGRAARALDDNSVPHPLPVEAIVAAVMGLAAILGTQAKNALAQVEKQSAPMVAAARTAKAMNPVVTVVFWVVLLLIETIAVRAPLADMLNMTNMVEKWVAAAAVAVLTNVAGIALSWAWFHGLSPDSDESDGMVGRHLLRVVRVMVVVVLLMFVAGLVWGRILYAADTDAGLLAETVNSEPAHALMIGGLMLLSGVVSFAIKSISQATDSRTILRLDVALQRFRVKVVGTLEADLGVVTAYADLESRARVVAQQAPATWERCFLEAVPADTHDRWVEYLAEHPSTKAELPAESPWVATVRTRIVELVGRSRRLALPSLNNSVDLVDTVDVREDSNRP